MRFFSLFATVGLVAFAAAQDATSTETSATGSAASPSETGVDPIVGCLQSCGSNNICCQAACVGVPCPDESQVNATTECAAQCPQGNGTQAETEEYASCQSSCISSYFLTASTAQPTTAPTASQTDASGVDATATDSAGSEETGSGDGETSPSSTGSAAPSATGDSGAAINHVGKIGAGFLALVIAGLSL